MHLRSNSFRPYDFLDPRLAFGTHDPTRHVRLAGNRNPHLAWSDPPAGTKSFALLVFDPDVPSEGSKVNREGVTVPLDLPRVDFFHWVVADLPADVREIAEGAHSDGVVAGGKPLGPTPSGGFTGLNDYTGWFAGDESMKGDYAGYDGPGPPWNDERVHGYRFVVYALDVPTLGLSGKFGGADLRRAMEGHVLGSAQIVGLYTINPGARQQ
jgi:Raf kinase inhibitor-like YbhB/YbcL family protein